MNPAELRRRLPVPSRLLWLAALLLVAITVAAAGVAVWGRHEDVFASYQREMTNLRIALAAQAARLVQAVDLVLQETQKEVRANGVTTPEQFKQRIETEEFYRFFHARAKNLPQADSIGVVDADGMVVNGSRSWPHPVFDVSDRDYFRHFRDHDDPGVFVSIPVPGKLTGAWQFFLARRLNGPHGEFLGVAIAGIHSRYFEEFYQAITLREGGSVAILRQDGILLARYPHVETMMGERISPKSPWYARVAEGGGSYRSPGYIDGIARMVSVQPLRDYPLAIGVTISEKAALAEWRRQSVSIGLGAFGMVVGIVALFGTLARRARRSERNTAELAEAAEALRQSEARFRDFASTSSDWFWETDRNHRITYVSEGIRAFGQDPSVFIGRSRIEYAAPSDRTDAKWQQHLATLERHEPFRDFAYTLRFVDQREITASISGSPVFDSEGEFAGYRGTGRDITAVKASEAQLRAVIQNLDRVQRIAGVASISVDLRTERIIWSPQACALFGITPEITDSTQEFMLGLIHPDDRERAYDAAQKANATGTSAQPLEYRIVRPDGIERSVYRENAIEVDDYGVAVRRIITYQDITDFKTTEARLREAMSNLERAQRLAHMGSDVWDLRTGAITWSAEAYRIFGVDPESFVPTLENFLELVVPEDRPKLIARRKAILKGKCSTASEFSVRRPDGELRHIYSEAEIVFDDAGKPIRWVGMRQDITERRRIERSLREAKEAAEAANLAKSQFLANMSHELRTPLNGIIGFSELLERGISGPLLPKQLEYVCLIQHSADHLHSVINDILDLAKVDAGKLELREERGIDPVQIVDASIQLVAARAKEGELALSVETGRELPLLIADGTRLKQILLNLVSNAVKFTEPGGQVVLATRRTKEGGVAFEVRDTGPGMTAEEIKIALEPFGQVDARLARRHEGTGLGLPLAQRLAELHGGSLRISSSKGRGTIVTVTLPADRVMRDPASLFSPGAAA